ncbi:MAG: 2-oxo acid dehydrogenase subunit E2 [Eubacteriaceae bacterium]|nr:2-oxo acid dehydrogenase subunit E2 [Eubacteriaceae bacterium]
MPIPITPKARKYAKENKLDLSNVEGTGEYGAITYEDLASRPNAVKRLQNKKATQVAKQAACYYGIDIDTVPGEKLSKQDVIAAAKQADGQKPNSKRQPLIENVKKSIQSTAPFTLFCELDTEVFMHNCAVLKETAKESYGISISSLDMYMHAVAQALAENTNLLSGERINLAFAAQAGSGLIAPVIFDAAGMNAIEIASEKKRVLMLASTKALTNDSLTGGTFTVSSLAFTPVTFFTPIINYPQRAILGIGASEKKPCVYDGSIAARYKTCFSLTLDHFFCDGMDGGRFFESLKEALSQPLTFYTDTTKKE